MDRREMTALLALVAARDGRTVGAVEVEAWLEDVGRYDFATARQGVHRHYSTSRDYLRPFDLITQIRAVRGERLDAAGDVTPNADPDDPAAWAAELRALRTAIGDGLDPAAYLASRACLTGAQPRKALTGPVTTDEHRVVEATKATLRDLDAIERQHRADREAAAEAERARQLADLAPLVEAETATATSPDVPCPKCGGCGRIANDDDETPWSVWEALPLKNAAAVLVGLVVPIPCPLCSPDVDAEQGAIA